MKLQLIFNMDNAAFEDTNGYEAAVLLRKMASKVDGSNLTGGDEFTVTDSNGNKVGKMKITGK